MALDVRQIATFAEVGGSALPPSLGGAGACVPPVSFGEGHAERFVADVCVAVGEAPELVVAVGLGCVGEEQPVHGDHGNVLGVGAVVTGAGDPGEVAGGDGSRSLVTDPAFGAAGGRTANPGRESIACRPGPCAGRG